MHPATVQTVFAHIVLMEGLPLVATGLRIPLVVMFVRHSRVWLSSGRGRYWWTLAEESGSLGAIHRISPRRGGFQCIPQGAPLHILYFQSQFTHPPQPINSWICSGGLYSIWMGSESTSSRLVTVRSYFRGGQGMGYGMVWYGSEATTKQSRMGYSVVWDWE
ncbi:hypothetical protein DFH08DRAFT_800398 [Mycena albidolilacea]|uniref:Uncharacterized protein n=1 Tax=Mycena albidolilacea TaxID=1033008 RepID=A0AAD7AJT9_9AGAR|nr:hypothetical protein DFH08DRAFT_800398 [Mycena albidolilacea]